MRSDSTRTGPSRRGVIGGALLLGASALLPTALAGTPRGIRRPVVAFHADQLYLDRSGLAEPYAPPAGLRSLDGHDEAALRRLVYGL